jgi:thiol-disulfide isomerase/thioredoxin
VEQLLAFKPGQANVLCDTPAPETYPKCKVETVQGDGGVGYVLRDMRGLTVRKLLDVNGSKKINRRSFYLNGQEVYRELDTNDNGEIDSYRWFNAGGSRHGFSSAENGKIDVWKSISAEEATAEVIAASAARDWDRLRSVLLTNEDLKSMGLGEKAMERVAAEMRKFPETFRVLTSVVPADAKWTRFDGHTPMAIAGGDAGAEKDLTIYQNGTISIEANGKSIWLRAPEIVRVGETWKLTSLPVVIDETKPVETVGVLVPAIDQAKFLAATSENDSPVEATEEVQKLVAELQKHDESMPKNGEARKLAEYHVRRHFLCASIGSQSKKLANRLHWYKQAADSLDAAVQTKEYKEGVEKLNQYSEAFAKTQKEKQWGGELAAYFRYRAINAGYSLQVDDKDHAKAQEKYIADLSQFIKDFPDSADAADALWQLGNGAEFAGKEHDALGYYRKLSESHADSNFAKKAAGAIRRIESVGRVARFVGTGLHGSQVDSGSLQGNVVLVHYWATWCEACVAEMPKIAALQKKFGGRGLKLLAINLDNDVAKAREAAQRLGITWDHIHENGGLDSEPAVSYGIVIMPTMMLLDESGKVLNRNLNANQLEVEVEKALSKKLASKPD